MTKNAKLIYNFFKCLNYHTEYKDGRNAIYLTTKQEAFAKFLPKNISQKKQKKWEKLLLKGDN